LKEIQLPELLRSIEWDIVRVVPNVGFEVIFDGFCWFDVKSEWLLPIEVDGERDGLSSE